jgi:pimeloyl-ACP methyl ester carboxylesterase
VGDSHAVRRVGLSTGLTMAYREVGHRDGPTVLLLHAWGESLRSFDRLASSITPALHVLAPDLRGHGDSDKPLTGYDLVSVADDIRAFMDACGVLSAVLFGASSGGYVAQQLAVMSPARVDGLVLAGTPFSLAGRPAFADEFERLEDPIQPAWAREFVAAFPVVGDVPARYLEDRVRDALSLPAAVWRLTLAGLTASVPPLRAGRIDAPTLAIWGDRDDVVSVHDQVALVGAIPGARRLVYGNVGHLVLWERPDQLSDDLTAFVVGLVASRAQPESS